MKALEELTADIREKKTGKITLVLTRSELLALTDTLDSFSAMSDNIFEDGSTKNDIKKLDKMLLRNGWRRQHK